MTLLRPDRSLSSTRCRLPTSSGLNVFVGGRVLQNSADVDAALMRERAVADERLVAAQRQIRQFGDESGQVRQFLKLSRPTVVWPSFNSRFARTEHKLALPQRSP